MKGPPTNEAEVAEFCRANAITGELADKLRQATLFRMKRAVEDTPAELSADGMALLQFEEAIYQRYQDPANYLRFPWAQVNEVLGPMRPGELWTFAARTGMGKTTFLLSLFDGLIAAGRRVLYVGLEQSPSELRNKWACMRQGLDPGRVLRGETDMLPRDYRERLLVEDGWQHSDRVRRRAFFAHTRFIDRAGLQKWTEFALKKQADVIIVDHIDRMQHGDGRNSFHELSQSVHLAKELAVKHNLVMVTASQIGLASMRGGDPLQFLMPVQLHELRGGGTKAEESDNVVGLYCPLKENITAEEMKAVRTRGGDPTTLQARGSMGVQALKRRLDRPGPRTTLVGVRYGRIVEEVPSGEGWGATDLAETRYGL